MEPPSLWKQGQSYLCELFTGEAHVECISSLPDSRMFKQINTISYEINYTYQQLVSEWWNPWKWKMDNCTDFPTPKFSSARHYLEEKLQTWEWQNTIIHFGNNLLEKAKGERYKKATWKSSKK